MFPSYFAPIDKTGNGSPNLLSTAVLICTLMLCLLVLSVDNLYIQFVRPDLDSTAVLIGTLMLYLLVQSADNLYTVRHIRSNEI